MVPNSFKLSCIASIKHGYAFEGEYFSANEKEHILLTPGNFHVDKKLYFGKNTKFYEGPIPEGYVLNNGDLLVVMTDLTKDMAILGNAVILESSKPVLHNQRIGKVEYFKDKVDKGFLCFALNSPYVRNRVKASASGTTVRHTSPSKILDVEFPFPPLPEQRKIAKILSTWDKAIATTEKLIETSKQQKKALMQQLLTGKKRLLNPETGKAFEGEWEEVKLGDIAKYQKGYTYKSNEYSEDSTENGFLTLKSIQRGGGYSSKGIKYLLSNVDNKFAVIEGDVVFAVTDLTRNAEVVGAPIFVPRLPFKNSYISMDLVKLQLDASVNKQFIYNLLKIPCNRNFMRARASGSTVLHLDIQGSKKLKLIIPKFMKEQQKIASVLTTADKEIEVLQAKLAHFKQEKKALMQQLLTGKRRVKVDEMEVA